MNLQIITYKRKVLPADLPQQDFSEGTWEALCVSPLPWATFNHFKRNDLVGHGVSKEEAIADLADQIRDVMLKNHFIEQVETSAIQV